MAEDLFRTIADARADVLARIAAAADACGIQNVVLTDPADAGLMAGLLRYFDHE